MQATKSSSYSKKVRRLLSKWTSRADNVRRKLLWRLVNGPSDDTVPVFIVGSQRSGTSMLGECLGRSPEIENLGESDARAFTDYFLRDDDTVERLIRKAPYRMMIFKPLKDSHRVDDLLAIGSNAKAIWAYRNYWDRINSAVKHFGKHPLDVFARYNRGEGAAWQLSAISAEDARLLAQFDIDRLSEFDGAALMWYIRNSLFFNQRLEDNDRVFLWSYDEFVSDPATELKPLTHFLGTHYYPYMTRKVHSRSIGKDSRPQLNPRIEELCDSMLERLEAVRKRKESRSSSC